jgi:hypothetical protein
MNLLHPSERSLGGSGLGLTAFDLAAATRCYCFSKSTNTSTASNPQQAVGDRGAGTMGDNSPAATGGSVAVGGNLITGTNVQNAGEVNVTTNAAELANQFTSSLQNITDSSNALLSNALAGQSKAAQEQTALTESALKTFADTSQATKQGLSQTTLTVMALGAAVVAGLYFTRKKA